MELIEEIITSKGKKLQILLGNLTSLPEEHKVDVLVISAFPNDYIPTPTSLIGALDRAGLSIEDLAANKEVDLRMQFHCWLSKEVNFNNIKRILCFEPTERKNPYSVIAGIFQSLMSLTITHQIETVAMPLVLTGNQGYDSEMVTEELIHTSLFWLNNESPLKTIKIVVKDRSKLNRLRIVTGEKKSRSVTTKGIAPPVKNIIDVPDKFDFFISYSRKDSELVNIIQSNLSKKFNIFFDKQDIDVGANWLAKINESMENSNRFIVCLSPNYLESKICKYEYTFCNLKFIEKGDGYVLPVYLLSSELPTHMQIINYFDAREARSEKVDEFCKSITDSYEIS